MTIDELIEGQCQFKGKAGTEREQFSCILLFEG